MPLHHEITVTVNGSERTRRVPVTMTLLTLLRDQLDLTGTKYACGEGECGACTVIVDAKSVCSCLMFAVDVDGREVVTIEGLALDDTARPLLDAFTEFGAVQCGFCSPGLVMQAKHLLDKNPKADRAAIARGIEGNICRCTGYVKIVDAIAAVNAVDSDPDSDWPGAGDRP